MPKILVKKNDKSKTKLHASMRPNINGLLIKPSKKKAKYSQKESMTIILNIRKCKMKIKSNL